MVVRDWMSCVRLDRFVPSYGESRGLLKVVVVLEKERRDLANEQLGQIHPEATLEARPPSRSLSSDILSVRKLLRCRRDGRYAGRSSTFQCHCCHA